MTLLLSMNEELVECCPSSNLHLKAALSKNPTPEIVTKVDPRVGPRLGVRVVNVGAL